MTSDKTLREALLKQNGIVPGTISDEEREEVRRMLARDKARVRRMKWAAIIGWLLVLLPYLAAAAMSGLNAMGIGIHEDAIKETIGAQVLMVFAVAMPYVAIALTISYFFRSRSLSSRQIQAQLSDIEEQLRRISESQKTAPPK